MTRWGCCCLDTAVELPDITAGIPLPECVHVSTGVCVGVCVGGVPTKHMYSYTPHHVLICQRHTRIV